MGKETRKGESKFGHKHHATGQGHHHHHKLTIHGSYDENGRLIREINRANEAANNVTDVTIEKDLNKGSSTAGDTAEKVEESLKEQETAAPAKAPEKEKAEQELKEEAEIQMLREKYRSGSLPEEDSGLLDNEASDKATPLKEEDNIHVHDYNQQRRENMSVSTFIHDTLEHAQEDLDHDIGLLHLDDGDDKQQPGKLSRNNDTYGLESDADMDLSELQSALNHTQESLYTMVLGDEK